ncbi:MAG: protein phosphatase 2C domain-containing protein [Lacunisphaera sp.]|nr:protein phosphatase 2C domain-containing protein [Lacunisphaera sp.]
MKKAAAVQVQWTAASDLGRVRGNNEDCWGVFAPGISAAPLASGRLDLGTGGALLVVSDGMGGALGGEEASRFCVEHIAQEIAARCAAPEPAAAMREALQVVHAALMARALSRPGWHGMGATLSALWLRPGGTAVLGHVGDSRIYLLHGSRLRQLTEDHSLGAAMVRRGEMTAEALTRFKYRSILEQVMGGDGRQIVPQVAAVEFAPGDAFGLCSDGLFGPLREKTPVLLQAALPAATPAAAEALIAAANAAGGPDNITVLLARVV